MDPKVDELLNRWEENWERGQPITAEQLCIDFPELLTELKWQIQALQAVEDCFGNSSWSEHEGSAKDSSSLKLNQKIQVTTEFQIDRLHATGGLGEVYLATDPLLQRSVAVKFPRSRQLSKDQLDRFAREAQVTGQLNHPGIVPVFALKHDRSGESCYVMRFIEGPTLKDHIDVLFQRPHASRRDFFSSFEVRQLLQIFVSLCNIVAYAHDRGIIHRDIKPSNVILGPFGETMLMDWGLAKRMTEPESSIAGGANVGSLETVVEGSFKTRDGQFMGTPAFASPEQRQGRIDLLDGRTDVYSLGALLFNMLTGSPPTQDAEQRKALRSRAGASVPHRLVAICHKALSEHFEQRYASVVSFREDIERYLAGEPISVVTETLWSRISRTIRRRSGLAASILVGISITAVAVGAGTLLLGQKNSQLRVTNEQLQQAHAKSLASLSRSKATTELLTQAIRAATPEFAQGKEPTLRQLLEQTSLQLQSDISIHPLVAADTHQVLADAYLSLGAYESAQQHADTASQMHRELSGENSSDALHAQATQAMLLSRRDRDEEAIVISWDALQRGRTLGDLDTETLIILIDTYALASAGAPNPNHSEIVDLEREAYQLARNKLGPNHLRTLRMSTNFAVAMMDANKLNEAKTLLMETRTAHEERLGAAHPETLVDTFNLIGLLYNQKEFKEAAALARAHRQRFEEVLGPDHQRTIRLGLLMAQIEFGLGNLKDSEREARLALERAVKALGPSHQNTFEARGFHANVLVALGRLDEAEVAGTEQYENAQKAFGDKHPLTVQAVTLLFDVADSKGDVEALAQWFEKLRGSQWEGAAQEALRAAKEKKSAQPPAS